MTTTASVSRMDPTGKGVLLGLANTLFIAFGLLFTKAPQDLIGLIVLLGWVPGAGIGAIEGAIARETAKWRPWTRLLAMAPLPLGFIYYSSALVRIAGAAYALSIPTVVAMLVLERTTRASWRIPPARSIA